MTDSRNLAFIGAALLFVGAFTPLISVPILGSVNYFQNGKGDGVFIVLLAAATLLLAGIRWTRFVLFTGLAAAAVMGWTWWRIRSGIAEIRAQIDSDLSDNPFRGLAERAADSIQLQWGWAVLLLGAAVTIAAGANAWREGRG